MLFVAAAAVVVVVCLSSWSWRSDSLKDWGCLKRTIHCEQWLIMNQCVENKKCNINKIQITLACQWGYWKTIDKKRDWKWDGDKHSEN